MKIKDLIKQLEEIENKDKYIHILGNETNGEDEEFDIIFNDIEVWDDGDESITLFLSNVTNKINNMKTKYKLFDEQRQEYKTDYNYNHIIYDDLEEVKNDLLSFHSIDYGGLEAEEFYALTLEKMLDLFGWRLVITQ